MTYDEKKQERSWSTLLVLKDTRQEILIKRVGLATVRGKQEQRLHSLDVLEYVSMA